MLTRLKFRRGQQRKFLREVSEKSNLSTTGLAHIVGVVERSYRDWQREKLNMSVKASRIFIDKFGVNLPESEEILIDRWNKLISERGRRGGQIYFSKYGNPATYSLFKRFDGYRWRNF